MTPGGAAGSPWQATQAAETRRPTTAGTVPSLALSITRFRAANDPRGERIATSWDALVAAARAPRRASSKTALPLWSPATFRGDYRAADRVERVFALGFDDDETPRPWPNAVALWSGLGVRGLLHTTSSHTPDAPRYRTILLLARRVSGDEYRVLWRATERRLADAGHRVGRAASDAARGWFVPARIGEGEYLAAEIDGRPLDVDALLADEARRAETRRRAPVAPVSCTSRYAAAALRRAAADVRIATEGLRNAALNRAAFSVGQLVGAGMIDRGTVEAVLGEAGEIAGLAPHEIVATMRSGLDAGQRQPREVRA